MKAHHIVCGSARIFDKLKSAFENEKMIHFCERFLHAKKRKFTLFGLTINDIIVTLLFLSKVSFRQGKNLVINNFCLRIFFVARNVS